MIAVLAGVVPFSFINMTVTGSHLGYQKHTSPYYPQSNGKVESWHRTVKCECIRPLTPLNLNDARRIVKRFVQTYNTQRLHSGIGYVTPQTRLEGLDGELMAERRRKLTTARRDRQKARWQQHVEEQRPILVVA
jgi:hypothetical protein